jgi:hypothetical protein
VLGFVCTSARFSESTSLVRAAPYSSSRPQSDLQPGIRFRKAAGQAAGTRGAPESLVRQAVGPALVASETGQAPDLAQSAATSPARRVVLSPMPETSRGWHPGPVWLSPTCAPVPPAPPLSCSPVRAGPALRSSSAAEGGLVHLCPASAASQVCPFQVLDVVQMHSSYLQPPVTFQSLPD